MEGSPFHTSPRPSLPKNYADTFVAADYECKDSIELESYARNLHNYLLTLLPQEPFPQFLFDKLEKRLDGISSILQKRSKDLVLANKEKAKERLEQLAARISSTEVPTTTGMDETRSPPIKKRRIHAPCQDEVRNSLKRHRETFSFNESQAEEEEEPTSLSP